MSFIFVGRLEELKGIKFLLQTWKSFGIYAPELIVCGTGPIEEWCKNFILSNKMYSVKMKGFVCNSEVKNLIAASKALILPTQCYEGFPMTIVEAFSVGTPVIVPDFGNTGCLVTEGITGCKYTPNSEEGLREAVFRIETYKNINVTTKDEYKKKYTKNKNYRYLMEIYNKIMQ